MNEGEFIVMVQRGADIGSPQEAERITREALEVLHEHLGDGKAKELADLLPHGVARYLQQEEHVGSGEALALDEFVERVGERTDARDPEQAAVRARAVLRAVEEAAMVDDTEDTDSPLPQEFGPLLEQGPGESGLPGSGG